MAEEKLDKVEEKVEEKQEAYVPKDKWEEKAIASGKWKPQEEWDGDPEEWRPAREYIERGELFDKIDSQNKEVKQLRKVLDTLKNHHLNVKQEAMEDAIALLKKQRESARKEEDLGKVLEITEEIDTLKVRQQKAIAKAQAELNVPIDAEPSPEFKEWHKDNSWYRVGGKDAMSVYANAAADMFLSDNPRATDKEVFKHVEQKVREEFSEKFKSPKHDLKVEGSGTTRPGGKGSDKYELSPQEKQIGETLVKSGVLTWEQYIKDLKAYDKGTK